MNTLFNPPDVIDAHDSWGCNCGPAAFAAIMRRSCESIRKKFHGFEQRRYTNLTQMESALTFSSADWSRVYPPRMPDYGLAFIQIEGPWTKPGVNPRAAYLHTHWIGTHDDGKIRWIWDVNEMAWAMYYIWEETVLRRLIEHHKRATGWRVKAAIEVRLA